MDEQLYGFKLFAALAYFAQFLKGASCKLRAPHLGKFGIALFDNLINLRLG